MRVSAHGQVDTLKTSLLRSSQRLGHLHEQATAGKRVLRLSDDPVVAPHIVRGHRALATLDSRRLVLSNAQRLLGAADIALGDMSQALQRCHTIGLRALTPYLGDSERLALASEIRHLSTTIMTAGNAEVQGTYIFAGTRTNAIPLAESAISDLPVAYQGNYQPLSYQLSPSEKIPVGFTAAQILNYTDAAGQRPLSDVDRDVFGTLTELADNIEAGDLSQVAELSTQVESLYKHILGHRSQVGLMVQRCELATTACDTTELQLRQLLSADEDLDLATAIVDLSREQTAYQAVLGMTSRLLALPNLFEANW